ncbi:helix-turn-helix domain-containing protein [Actinoplanes sp. Pm04-4]|uniref:Helix-turn-helix domain-containing protein n=1 Tax=Paractinoplanes pyxinae TaxID=2997416 RepID=A0ABT4AS91_9ACTN|nr:helix-turn-helix domain-containing protein [Actinoplanes pyxinae]MCY1137027.1 helix-turn-helix domain-containing protein [Actinoplanes pyxinae]
MRTLFDTRNLPVADRVAAWEDVCAASLIQTEIGSPDPPAFAARLGALPLGAAQLVSLSYTSLSSRRTAKLIKASDPEFLSVGLIRSGDQGIDQNDTSALLGAGDLVVYDSSQPFEAVNMSGMRPAETIVLQFPKGLLPLPESQVFDLCATPIPGADGIAHVFTQFLVSLAREEAGFTARDSLRLGHTAIDLVTAVLAHHLDRGSPPLRSPSQVLYLRITSFIDRNLHRADLRPATVAAAHQISLRYLHRIFEQHHDVSLGAHIRARRIDRARRDLADPHLSRLTIASIAGRCGFTRAADFSRAFRTHTGVSPRDYREQAQRP